MINDLSETHLVILEKNPFLMANFMYSFLELFQNGGKKREKNKSPYKVTNSHNRNCNDVNESEPVRRVPYL